MAINCFTLVQISQNPSWFHSECQVLVALRLSLSIQGSKITVSRPTIMTFYSVSTCCLRLKKCRAVNCSDSITTVLLLIEPEKLLINRLLTMLSMNVESALEHAFELMAGIFNISFKEQQLVQIIFLSFTCWKLQISFAQI